MPTFTLECFQNEYLPQGAGEVNAVVTVTAADLAAGGGPATISGAGPASEVIIVDTSGSMGGSNIRQARSAVAAAIDCIRDGVQFAVIAGDDHARMLYPATPSFAVASADTRYDATRASGRLDAGGGTAIGKWLSLATRLFADQAGINHAILLTDGKDEHESPEQLDAALGAAAGVFQCDCRGWGRTGSCRSCARCPPHCSGPSTSSPSPTG